jgi:hypothetical protein
VAIAETSLQPPDEVYGEYATANGFEESKDGTDTPLRETPPELEEEIAVLDAAAADALTDTVGS